MKKRLLQYASCLVCGLAIIAPLTVGAKDYVDNKPTYDFTVETQADTQTLQYRYLDLGFNEEFVSEAKDAKFDVKMYSMDRNKVFTQVGRVYNNQPVNVGDRMCYRWQFTNTNRLLAYKWTFWAKNNEEGKYPLNDPEFRLCSEEN